MNIDFDEWAQLYKTDPAEFERRRKEAIATTIDAAPEERQESMYTLQREIDTYRASHSPQDTLAFLAKRQQELLLDLQDQLLDVMIIFKDVATAR